MTNMADKIVIERLEFQARCGITPEERERPQPMAIDLELDCETGSAAASGHLSDTVDYARVVDRIVDLGSKEVCALLETFGEKMLTLLFTEFPISRARLWLRKLAPPISPKAGSVGIKLDRPRAAYLASTTGPVPSRFVTQQLHRLPKGLVLDVACGSGRHALYLAAQGFEVEAIDRDQGSLEKLSATAAQRRLPLNIKQVDLERSAEERPEFPPNTYDAIVVCFYLHRPLFPWLIDALKPQGVLLYETFTIDNYIRYRHPRRWEFCLAQNELLRLTSSLRVLSYDEGEHEGGPGMGSVFTAQLVAQKPGQSLPHGSS
jgi:dihydroneopterin aldolase